MRREMLYFGGGGSCFRCGKKEYNAAVDGVPLMYKDSQSDRGGKASHSQFLNVSAG
jgi:hypothetical protein